MANRNISILHIGIVLCLLHLCISCENNPDVGLYKFSWTCDDGDRPFIIYRPDSSFIDTTHIPGIPFYEADVSNLWCHDSSQLELSHEGDSCCEFQYVYPLYVHRPTGRTDTLYLGYYRTQTELSFGHVHRECFLDNWIILECRLPGRILGYAHLFDEAYRSVPIDKLHLGSYTFKGQRLIFESKDFDYWIINRLTTDLYGPLTEKELIKQLKELRVPLPIKLKSSYFPYRKHYKDGKTLPFPDTLYKKGFFGRYFPEGEKVETKVIPAIK